MELVMQVSILLMQFFAIAFALVVQGSAGYDVSPSPATFTLFPPIEVGRPAPIYHGKSPRSNGWTPESQPNVSPPPIALPPPKSAPVPQAIKGLVPVFLPSTPTVFPPHSSALPPSIVQRSAPLLPPMSPQRKSSQEKAPVPVSVAPVESPLRKLPVSSPIAHPVKPGSLPPSSHQGKAPIYDAPFLEPIVPVPVALPPGRLGQNPPALHPVMPAVPPPILPVPLASPPVILPGNPPAIHPITPGGPSYTLPAPLPNISWKRYAVPVSAPPNEMPNPLSPYPYPPSEGSLVEPPSPHKTIRHSNGAPAPAPPNISWKRYAMPVAAPPNEMPNPLSPFPYPPSEGSLVEPPSPHKTIRHSNGAPAPAPPNISWKRYAMPVAAPPNEMPNPLSPFPYPPSEGSLVEPPSPHKTIRHSNGAPAPAPPNISWKRYAMPVAAPPNEMPNPLSIRHSNGAPAPAAPNISWKRYAMPVAAPPNEMPNPLSPYPYPPSEDSFPVEPPSPHKTIRHSNGAPAHAPLNIIKSSAKKDFQPPASSPLSSFYKNHHPWNKITSHAPAASHMVPPHASKPGKGPATSPWISLAPLHTPENFPQTRQRHRASPPLKEVSSVSPTYSPYPSSSHISHAPSPSPTNSSGLTKNVPFLSPRASPTKPNTPPLLPPALALPPPPPNEDCTSIVCTDPLTNTPPGSPCFCVWPMQVGLRLGVSLYTFFPLVSELAQEIASGVFVKQSQVRIMGANAANQEPEKTIVLIDLVPLGAKFDNTTAYLTYERFWHKQVAIKASFFGDYEVLYVRYPGLPPSPPSAHSSIGVVDGGPNNGSMGKPLGVDVRRRPHKNGLSGSVIAIIVLSASVAAVLCSAIAWILMFKCTDRVCQQSPAPQTSLPSLAKPAGTAGSMMGSGPSSVSLSFGSSIPPYTGSTKTFSSNEMEKATDNFDSSRIVGEGGFGVVYSGVLEDGTKVAVKIIKKDDQQGGREFLAEVEMLSRLHHRNLVKLIGMCTEEHNRCLVYELIANGSVESHLHGVDMETCPLDWATRMKIALGAARGLAYLHEDSSPRVIHRDFKSSNILLEHDFTPKVSDFGLARTALDEKDTHISTRVMGTFGYVAPEYAMTGHLLVKSDVYSYGVVLLELLTGKKPVDMSQPPGHENLVAWARPLLTSKEGLESIIDPSLGSNISFDSVAKFAAIASMCVQPEVTHRPFMGEVVQALKLVCNECDETKEVGSKSCSQEDFSIDVDTGINSSSGQLPGTSQSQYVVSNCDRDLDVERGLSMSDLFGAPGRSGRQESGSFRRHSSSGPFRTRRRQFWQRFGRLSRGSMSEHGVALSLWPGSH